MATGAVLENDPVTTVLTVRRKLVLVLYCPSLTVKVMVAVPDWPETGVTVTVRLLPLPPKTTFSLGTNAGLEEFALKARLATGVSASPMVKLSGPVEPSTGMVWLGMLLMVGGAVAVVRVMLHPPAMLPVEPELSSVTYKDHDPFGDWALKAASVLP